MDYRIIVSISALMEKTIERVVFDKRLLVRFTDDTVLVLMAGYDEFRNPTIKYSVMLEPEDELSLGLLSQEEFDTRTTEKQEQAKQEVINKKRAALNKLKEELEQLEGRKTD